MIKNIRANLALELKPKFKKTYEINNRPNKILDIGIANFSYAETKLIFSSSIYHGVDCSNINYEINEPDKFFLCNLEEVNWYKNLSDKYDLIIANHVLEHIKRGDDVFQELCSLMAPNGILYCEFPSIITAFKKKKKGMYHFHDDPTHRRFYNLENLANIGLMNDCKIISCGPTSTTLKNCLSIPRAIYNMLLHREWESNLLHISNKINHIILKKNSSD